MPYCSVKWCGINNMTEDYRKYNINFHRFPKTPQIKCQWVKAIRLRKETWYPTYTSVICSRHFKTDCYYMKNGRRRLRGNAVPTEHLMITDLPLRKGNSNKPKIRQQSHRHHLVEMNEIPITEQLEGQLIISKVYHYLEEEYTSLKPYFGTCDMSPLADILRRTAEATGVSKRTVVAILKNERIAKEKKKKGYFNPEHCLLDHDYDKSEEMQLPDESEPKSNPPQTELLVDKQNEMQYVITTYNPPEESAPLEDKFVFDRDVEVEDITVEPDITDLCFPVDDVVQDAVPCPKCDVEIQTEDEGPVQDVQDCQNLDMSESIFQQLLNQGQETSAKSVKMQLPKEKFNEKVKSTYPRIDVIIERLQCLHTSVRRPVRDRMPLPKPHNKLNETDTIIQQPKSLDSVPKLLDSVPKPLDSVPKPLDSVPKPLDSVPKPLDSVPKPLDNVRADRTPSQLRSYRMPSDSPKDKFKKTASIIQQPKPNTSVRADRTPSQLKSNRMPSKSPKDKSNKVDNIIQPLKPLDKSIQTNRMASELPEEIFDETDNIIEQLMSLDTSVRSEQIQSELKSDRVISELIKYRIPKELPNDKLNDLEKLIYRLLALDTSVRMQSKSFPKDEINDMDYITRRLQLMDTSIKLVNRPKNKLNEEDLSIQRIKSCAMTIENIPKPPEVNIIEVDDAIQKLKSLATSVEIKNKSYEDKSKDLTISLADKVLEPAKIFLVNNEPQCGLGEFYSQYNPGEDSKEESSNKREEQIQPSTAVDKDQICQDKDTMSDAIRRLQSLATSVEIKAEILDKHLKGRSNPNKKAAQEKVSYKCDVQIKTVKATTEKNYDEKTIDAIRRLQSLSSIEVVAELPDDHFDNFDNVIGEKVWEPDETSLDEYRPRCEFSDYYRNFMKVSSSSDKEN